MSIDTTGGFSEDLEDVFASQPAEPEMRESVNAWIWDSTGRGRASPSRRRSRGRHMGNP